MEISIEARRSKLRVHRLENRETRWKFQTAGDLKRQKRKVDVIEVAERVVSRSRNRQQRKAMAL